MPVFPLQGTVRLMDLHCLLLLFISLGEFKTLLPFCALLSLLARHNFKYLEPGKHIGLLPSMPSRPVRKTCEVNPLRPRMVCGLLRGHLYFMLGSCK